MYEVGVVVSYECGVADSRQLRIRSTNAQSGNESYRVMQAFKALYQVDILKVKKSIRTRGAIIVFLL